MTVKKTVFLLFAAIVTIALTGCSSNTVSGDVMESVSNGKSMIIYDDLPCQHCWAPKDRKVVSAEVSKWLKEATPYKDSIPKDSDSSSKVISANNISPSTLHISNKLTISPCWYLYNDNQLYQKRFVDNVIEIDKSGEKSYWESKELYNWLKNDRWKPEFEKEFS